MRHQRFSPVSVLEGLWVQGDLTNFSGPGLNPQVSYLCGAWWGWGGTFPVRQQGRKPPGREGGVSQQGVTLPSLHSADNVIIYPSEATLALTTSREELPILLWHKE